MKRILILAISSICLFAVSFKTISNEDKQSAESKGMKAIELMDQGRYEESLNLLDEAIILDPDRFDYPYEKAYAYYLRKEYKKSIEILSQISSHNDVTDQSFQLFGNAYDMIGDSSKAIEIYNLGLKKFPNSGKLYLEKGIVFASHNNYNDAVKSFEMGVSKDPKFPSNYYRLAAIFSQTKNPIWGLFYGEIFMNLERNTKRTESISKLLFNIYKDNIIFETDTSFKITFAKLILDKIEDAKEFKLPLKSFYEMQIVLGTTFAEKNKTIDDFSKIRTASIQNFNKNFESIYKNSLSDYHTKILNAGHLEAYNHWLMMRGDEENFEKWQEKNKFKWANFITWFKENSLTLDDKNYFVRTKFEK